MPRITVCGKILTCAEGTNLRQVLLKEGIPLYNGKAKIINCLGIGTCGTCAVEVEGDVSPANWKEQARISLPPHALTKGRRLACQIQVQGDLRLTKYNGFWGQGDEPVWSLEIASEK
ncbi:MAG: (2Fe-2S)-binding protein [Gomphosphaeria aponina SAG 52.96 = DSM 107014]|uniref:(2Fe-2S)-binding protein n=1 Tax=Gomphosphaeria aponina SAG 52.96 = DSM 107014 TaxID=1521640 RepID=A0A941JS27_9CHRO|nr:(2Fe-2S)-binding protein [Gomphosphaeria aponina SAG 52.96 = DSM 107014]